MTTSVTHFGTYIVVAVRIFMAKSISYSKEKGHWHEKASVEKSENKLHNWKIDGNCITIQLNREVISQPVIFYTVFCIILKTRIVIYLRTCDKQIHVDISYMDIRISLQYMYLLLTFHSVIFINK